jgi:copper chaperone CopZ
MKRSFQVKNVKCGGCASTLTKDLAKEFGIVEVDLEVEPRVITLDIEEEAIPALRAKLIGLGYPMSDEKLSAFQNVGTTAKSYVSCAIGKMS